MSVVHDASDYITIRAPDGSVSQLLITQAELILGRDQIDPANDTISRRHVKITRTATGYDITDVSSNGTLWMDDSPLPLQTAVSWDDQPVKIDCYIVQLHQVNRST